MLKHRRTRMIACICGGTIELVLIVVALLGMTGITFDALKRKKCKCQKTSSPNGKTCKTTS
jgi:hypothetical protein